MKKQSISIPILFLLTLSLNLSGQSFKGEEAAVVKAIEDDIRYFDQRDYDKWAAMWVHEPYVQTTWANPGDYGGTFSWEELDSFGKQFMKNNPTPVPTVEIGKDFTFLIKENLAVVNYEANGEQFTRILEKRGGHWKMAQLHRIQIGAYQATGLQNRLKTLSGHWSLIPGTVQVKNSQWTMSGVSCLAEETASGIRFAFIHQAKNPTGDILEAQEEISIAFNSSDQKIFGTRVWSWTGSGQSFVSTGTCRPEEDGKLTLITKSIGAGAEKVQHNFQPEGDGQLALETIFFPGEDREWSISYTLEKK